MKVICDYNYVSDGSSLELIALTLHWAEGSKEHKRVEFTNSDAQAVRVFSEFLKRICNVNASRLKGRLQIHDGNNADEAVRFWSTLTGAPQASICVSRRPVKASNKTNKHPLGIFSIRYNSVGLKKLIDLKVAELKTMGL